MCHIYFLIFLTHTQGKSHLVFDYQFAFLKPGYSCAYLLQFLTTDTVQVFNNLVVDSLLFHYEWILGIGIEVKPLALETAHVLGGKDNAQSLITTYGN